jgi:hypothetical protein
VRVLSGDPKLQRGDRFEIVIPRSGEASIRGSALERGDRALEGFAENPAIAIGNGVEAVDGVGLVGSLSSQAVQEIASQIRK